MVLILGLCEKNHSRIVLTQVDNKIHGMLTQARNPAVARYAKDDLDFDETLGQLSSLTNVLKSV